MDEWFGYFNEWTDGYNNLMADWIQYFNGLKHEWNILMDGWMEDNKKVLAYSVVLSRKQIIILQHAKMAIL